MIVFVAADEQQQMSSLKTEQKPSEIEIHDISSKKFTR
jgi:hypothetical protein